MTTIAVHLNREHEYTGIDCFGHSGYGYAGQDVVCAAISVLVTNTVNSLESFTEDKFVLTSDQEEAWISFRFSEKVSEKCVLLLDSLMLGLQAIQNLYGSEYILIEFKEV